MNSVQERLAKLGMGVNDAGLTEEQSFRNDAGQAVYTGAALPDAPPISLTNELGKLNAAEASSGSGQVQQYNPMGAELGSPDIQFGRETPLESTNSDPIKALKGEDEIAGTKDLVPNSFSKEQQADYDSKISELSALKGELDKVQNDYGLSGQHQKSQPGAIEGIKKNIADMEKDIHEMKYNKKYDFNKKDNYGMDEITGGSITDVQDLENMNKFRSGNGFPTATEVTYPPITGDPEYDANAFNDAVSYHDNYQQFPGYKKYMKNSGAKNIDPTKGMLLALEGTNGDGTGAASTKAYGLTTDKYNALKKANPGKTDEQLFDIEYSNMRSKARRLWDKQFGGGQFDGLPKEAKSVIQLSIYRGDLKTEGYKWPKLVVSGRYQDAAEEILRHRKGRASKKNKTGGIPRRLYLYYKILNSIQPVKPLA